MSPSALLLILVAAVAHASWNLAAKRAGAGGTPFVFCYIALSALVLVPVTLVFAGGTPSWFWLLSVVVNGLLQLAYFLLLQRGYALGDMSVVYPLSRGTGPLLAVVFAMLVFGERPSAIALAGAFLVVCGVFVIGSAGASSGGPLGPSVFYALATGTTIAAYTLWDANAVTRFGVPPLVEFTGGSVLDALLLLPLVLRRLPAVRSELRAHGREVVIVALLSPLAYILVLYALQLAPVSLVAPARELSIVLGGLLAWRILGEPNPGRRIAGAVIVLTGIAALAA